MMRAQGPQYYYEPPRSGRNFLEGLRPLIEPPLAYVTFLVGIGLALYLLTFSDFNVYRYGAHILILLLAFPVHELSHAIVADRLGDPTPRRYGRITLNPFVQLNLIGSILMLIIGLGWAYVPVSPQYLRPNPRTGHMIVAAAGPISNLVMAVFCALLWYLASPILIASEAVEWLNYVYRTLSLFAWINIALFLFNLVPIAPLDGFTVLKGLLPYPVAYQLEKLQRFGMLIFLALFFVAPILGLPVLDWLIFIPASWLMSLLFSGA
jgi:Zn-dependent protease